MTKHVPMFVLLVILSGCTKTLPPPQQSEVAQQPTPVNAPKPSVATSIARTTWVGTDSDGDYYEYSFQSDGALHYKSPSGFYKNGSWKQDGNEIYMETNNKNTERKGTINGNRMEGDAWNVDGDQWTWVAEKK
jgi:hypothetical protein